MLRQSIKDVGLWEGVIARKTKQLRYQIAFGHHRLEAGRRELGQRAQVLLIVRDDLDDEKMLQFLGRENLEDYATDFLPLLECWEAAVQFLLPDPEGSVKATDVARLLGWTRPGEGKGGDTTNHFAAACDAAARLIAAGHLQRKDLVGLSIDAVQQITGRVSALHKQTERLGKKTGQTAAAIEATKQLASRAGAYAAKQAREGKVAPRDLRGTVDVEVYRGIQKSKKQTPMFAVFGKAVLSQINKIVNGDMLDQRLTQIKKSLGQIEMAEDATIVKHIAIECQAAGERFLKWNRTFTDPKICVVPLKEIAR